MVIARQFATEAGADGAESIAMGSSIDLECST